jgi:hypothetical protein
MKKILAMFVLAAPFAVTATRALGSSPPEQTLTTKADNTATRETRAQNSPNECEPQLCEWPTVFDPETCGCRF